MEDSFLKALAEGITVSPMGSTSPCLKLSVLALTCKIRVTPF